MGMQPETEDRSFIIRGEVSQGVPKPRILSCLVSLARTSLRSNPEGNMKQHGLDSAIYGEDMVGYAEGKIPFTRDIVKITAIFKDTGIPRQFHRRPRVEVLQVTLERESEKGNLGLNV